MKNYFFEKLYFGKTYKIGDSEFVFSYLGNFYLMEKAAN